MKSSQYVALFLDEAQLLLEQAQICLDKLPTADAIYVLQQELFRILHTLKGMASTLVDFPFFEDFTRLSHSLESLLDTASLTEEVQELLQEGIFALQTLEQNIAHPQLELPVEIDELLSKLSHFSPSPPAPTPQAAPHPPNNLEQHIQKLQAKGQTVFWLKIKLMSGCLMKSVRAMLVLHNLKAHSEYLSSHPDVNSLQSGDFGDTFQILVATFKNAQDLQDIAEGVSEIESVSVKPYPVSTPEIPAASFKLNEFESRIVSEAQKQSYHAFWLRFEMTHPLPFLSARIAKAFRTLEENGEIIKTVPDVMALETEQINQAFEILLVTAQESDSLLQCLAAEEEIESSFQVKTRPFSANEPPQPLSTLAVSAAQKQPSPKAAVMLPKSPTASLNLNSVRVEQKHLDHLHQITFEMLMDYALHPQQASPLQDQIERLYTTQFALRFISAQHLFERYPRIIKELERALNKNIHCRISGEETWIPRTMADPLSNVLLHLLRNAADHGLESPENRKKTPKPQSGEIHFLARFEAHHLIIEVQDDGAGIDIQQLKARSISRGLLSQEEALALSHDEALELVFSPGLSTAQDTTEISGRGVGMDTVRNHIEQLQGTVQVHSETHKGSRFQLILPSSLFPTTALIVKSRDRFFSIAVPADQTITEHTSIDPAQPFFDLRHWCWHSTTPLESVPDTADTEGVYITLNADCTLKVDALMGTKNILQEALPLENPTTQMINAVGTLSQDTLVMGLNIEAIIQQRAVALSSEA